MSEHTFEDSIREIESMEPLDEWRARIDHELRNAGLTEAWNEAEAALPEGTTLGLYWQLGAWHATYQHKHTECPSCGGLHQCEPERETINWPATGPTPAAALRALTVKLQEARP